MIKKIRNFLVISRAKIQIATVSNSLIGIFLAGFYNNFFLIIFYVFLSVLLTTFASNINCLYDKNVDMHYKTELAKAINEIGERNVLKILLIEIVISILCIIYLFYNGYKTTAFLASLGLFLGYAYSSPPLRIKARGIISPFPVLVGLYMFPILGGWFLMRDDIPFYLLIFTFGYAFMNEGFILINTCEDYEEDKREGIKTWAHVFGLKRTVKIAFIFSFFGFLCLYPLLPYKNLLSLFFLTIFSISLLFSSFDIYKLSKSKNLKIATKRYASRMPLWFSITRYPLLFALLFAML